MDDNTDNNDANFVFVKLANGDNIMCTTFSNIDKPENLKHLDVVDPIQIFSFKIPHNGVFIEKYIMQSWVPFSSTVSTMIPMSNVVFVGRLKDMFIEKYMEYITDPNAQQVLEESNADDVDMDDDEGDEAPEELLEEMIKADDQKKKWYH